MNISKLTKQKACILIAFFVAIPLFNAFLKCQNVDGFIKKIETKLYSGKNANYLPDIHTDSLIVKQNIKKGLDMIDEKPDSAISFIIKALETSITSGSPKYISLSLENMGNYLINTDRFEEASKCYLTCLKIEEKFQNKQRIGVMQYHLGCIYNKMELTDKSMSYLVSGLKIFENLNDTVNQALTLSAIGRVYFDRNFWEKHTNSEKKSNYRTSLNYYQMAVDLLKNNKNTDVKAEINQAAAYVLNQLNQYDKALGYLNQNLKIYAQKKQYQQLGETYYLMGIAYKKQKKYDESIQYIKKALDLGIKYKMGGTHWLYEQLAENYYGAKDYKSSHDMYIKYINQRDSVLTLERSQQILDMESKYQTEKKELKIKSLEKQRILYGVIFIASVAALILFLRMLYLRNKNNKTQKKLAEQKVVQLEQEKQLVATQAILDGETAERTRLARDLHDGLGGMLSAVKLNLFDMKKDVVLEMDDVSRFNRVLEMLDNSIQELRRVAHNMMPESLSRYGLKIALEDFCNSFPHVKFHFYGKEERLDKTLKITIYRAVHELVNNAVKHAGANTINVQLIQQQDIVSINVQDDGKGFNPEEKGMGKGIQNIRNRVNSAGGTMNIFSSPEKGTEITIDIKLNQE